MDLKKGTLRIFKLTDTMLMRLAIIFILLWAASQATGQPCDTVPNMHGYYGNGRIMEPTKLYCSPNDSTKVLGTLQHEYVELLQAGVMDSQWYCKIKVLDEAGTIGYVLANKVAYYDVRSGCDCVECLQVYYCFPNFGLNQISELTLVVRNAQTGALSKLRVAESPAFKDVRLNYVNSIAALDIYYGNLLQGGPYCGGHYGNDFLFAVDKSKMNMYLLYLDSFAGDEDGSGHQSSMYAYQPNRTKGYFYNTDREYIDSIAVPDKLWPQHQNLLSIVNVDYETAINSEGEPDIDEHGYGTPTVAKKETTWYTLNGNKLQPVK